MKITNEYLQYRRVSKDLTIELDNGKEIMVNKSVYDNDNEYEPEWEIIEGKEIYDNLSEDKQNEVDDLISDYDI